MAASPQWKIYRDGEYVGCVKYAEDAAAMVANCGGGVVKHGHTLVVWREGSEEFPAGESYDGASEVMRGRVAASARATLARADRLASAESA